MPTGTLGRDVLNGTANDDVIVGDALDLPSEGKKRGGNDSITGALGDDILFGDAGNESNPALNGVLDGARGGNDRIAGGGGDDTIYGDGREMINGAQGGNDILFGDDGDDIIFGDADTGDADSRGGNDKIYGGAGNDTLYGDFGSDDDTTKGGNDILVGGAGNDIFVLGKGKDKIKDFVKDKDVLDFGNSTLNFTTLDTDGNGKLTSDDEFVTVRGKNVIIDLGAAAGGTAGVDVTIITVGKNIVLEATDFA
jgi:Ca2+-binding RTX toxin-like protein